MDKHNAVRTSEVHRDPSAGTSETGEHVFNVAVKSLVELFKEYHSGRFSDRLVGRAEELSGHKRNHSEFERRSVMT